MAIRPELQKLITATAPLWAGEEEVVRSYWDSPVRTLDTDLLWLRRQCAKEFNGTGIGEYRNLGVFIGPVLELQEKFPKIDAGVDRHDVLELLEGLHAEFEHFVLLADIYDAIRPAGAPPLNAQTLETWDEDMALTELRHNNNAEYGALGVRASRFTEGGYCGLFRAGMALKGRGGADEMIATACAKIYEDEFDHMLAGIAGLNDEGMSEDEWALLERLAAEQMRHRIRMRNAQFSFPLSDTRVEEIFAGKITPAAFDYRRAKLAA